MSLHLGRPQEVGVTDTPLLFTIQDVPQASAGCTRFELVYGHWLSGLLDVVCEGWLETVPPGERVLKQVLGLQERLE